MKTHSARRFSLVALFLLFLLVPTAFAQTGLVISQIYGGGGNSGAPYKYDYLELYNPTGSDISLSGYSIQYASATGTSWNAVALPNVAVPAGHYFLIQGASGTNGTNLPVTPDFTMAVSLNQSSIPNFAGGAGKIALVNNTTALSGTASTPISPRSGATCPNTNTSAIVDFVGYGTTATCYEGTAPTATASNTTAAIRTNPASDSNNNATDFMVGPPNPHNSSYGSPSASLSATGNANPSTITSGTSTLLTVTVVPAASSTGISVIANLSAIGGSASQALYDDGTHGDATAGDNVFSLSTNATTGSSGTVSLPVHVTDTQTHTADTSISLTVNQPVAFVPIHTIQGSKSLTATSVSSYAGSQVSTSGIVTGVGSVGFFIQAKDSDADSDPSTPEGIYVYMGAGKVPTSAVIGNELQVTGAVSSYPAVTASHTPATEISSAIVTLLSPGNPLPTPVNLTASMLTPGGGLYQLTRYEGMRVTIDSLTSTSGTDGTLTEATETVTSNGQFYAVITGTARPFREPGIDIRDVPPAGAPANVARFDDNPERILVDSTYFAGSAINLSTGSVLQNVSGVLDFTYSSDSYYDPSRLLLDSSYSRSNVSGGLTVQPVSAPANNEFTVAAFNIERFFNPNSADNVYYNPVTGNTGNSSAVNVTQAAYNRRLAKVSLAIRNVLGSPDVVALEETENQSVANDIAMQISADAIAAGQSDPQYIAYGTGTTYAPYTNDVGGISVGFLVKPSRVTTLSVNQYGQNMTMPDGAIQVPLNDRPPLVLHAGIKRTGAKDYPVTVIVNHLRSLSGVSDPSTGPYVRSKKELQAEYLAQLIQGFQSAGEHVVSVGDYNVFEFSDGLTDVMATITGQNLLPADQVVAPGAAGIVNPPATDLVTLLPPSQRWSYQEYGNAQVLDHIVATADLVAAGAHIAYAHFNSDFPNVSYNDASTPAHVSDHDAAVGYFAIAPPSLTATLSPSNVNFGNVTIHTTTSNQPFTLTNTGDGDLAIGGITVSSDFTESDNCGSSLPYSSSCTINVVFAPRTAGTRSGTLTVNTTSAKYSSTLSGVANPVITPAPGSTLGATTNFTWNAGPGVTQYQILVGTTLHGYDLSGPGVHTTATNATVTIPATALPVYVRFYWLVGTTWYANDYTYTAPGTPTPAGLTSPTPGTTLTGSSITFGWSAGVGVSQYDLMVGTTLNGSDLYNSGHTTATSSPVVTVPANGLPVYVRLYSLTNGVWSAINYTYTAAGTPTPSILTSPTPGSTLTGSSVTFGWTQGIGVTQYDLMVGTTLNGHDLYDSGHTTATSSPVIAVPANGLPVYARLYSLMNGVWYVTNYTYTAGGTPTPSVLLTPNASPLTSPTTFTWSRGVGVSSYEILVGTTLNGHDLYGSPGVHTTNLTSGPVALPSGGKTIYVRLYSLIGQTWTATNYTFTGPQ